MGFQASNVYKAIEEINKMLNWKPSKEEVEEWGKEEKCKIFLGYTSNMISCGMREVVRFLVQHKLVDCVVTTAGGIEEDIIKCLAPTFLTDSFSYDGREARQKGQNRIGNLILPNNNYCKFEDFLRPVIEKMVEEQNKDSSVNWTPSKLVWRLGKEINNEESVYYWCFKNEIPVFCPAITDGSIGDVLYFSSYNTPSGWSPLRLDLLQDIVSLNNLAAFAKKTGMVILGGGLVKHHICNAN